MIVNADPSDDSLTFATFHEGTAERFGRTGVIFMAIEAFVTLEESVAVFAKLPLNEGTVLCMTQFTQVPERMTGDFVESFLTAGKFATAVQKYCWRLNTKCN